jgi:hypothetical protein
MFGDDCFRGDDTNLNGARADDNRIEASESAEGAGMLCNARSELDQTPAGCGRDGLGAADNVELGENAADVRLHGGIADK